MSFRHMFHDWSPLYMPTYRWHNRFFEYPSYFNDIDEWFDEAFNDHMQFMNPRKSKKHLHDDYNAHKRIGDTEEERMQHFRGREHEREHELERGRRSEFRPVEVQCSKPKSERISDTLKSSENVVDHSHPKVTKEESTDVIPHHTTLGRPFFTNDGFGDILVNKTANISTVLSNGLEIDKNGNAIYQIGVPGCDANDISVHVNHDDNQVRISGVQNFEDYHDNNDGPHFSSRMYRSENRRFHRQFTLPDNYNVKDLTSSVDNGVLTIKCKKASHETTTKKTTEQQTDTERKTTPKN